MGDLPHMAVIGWTAVVTSLNVSSGGSRTKHPIKIKWRLHLSWWQQYQKSKLDPSMFYWGWDASLLWGTILGYQPSKLIKLPAPPKIEEETLQGGFAV